MPGTILLTGANSSLDNNAAQLRATIARHSTAKDKAFIRGLDLADHDAVHDFASSLAAEIAEGKVPRLAAVVCNAYYWNLKTDAEITQDGLEKTLQVGYVSHVALVMRLLGSFTPQKEIGEGARVILIASDVHKPGSSPMGKIPPLFPDDLDALNKPDTETDKDKMVTGFWSRLEKDSHLSNITAVAVNPGTLTDSRAFRTNVPLTLQIAQKLICGPAGVVELATGRAHAGERGYFTVGLGKDESAPESRDREKQERLWAKSMVWARIDGEKTALKTAF